MSQKKGAKGYTGRKPPVKENKYAKAIRDGATAALFYEAIEKKRLDNAGRAHKNDMA